HGVGDPGAEQALDALLHLGGGLVGEGDREDLAGPHAAFGEQVGDAVGEDPGLARSRPRHDEQRGAGVRHGFPLGGVQAFEERLCRGHPSSLRGIPGCFLPSPGGRVEYRRPPARRIVWSVGHFAPTATFRLERPRSSGSARRPEKTIGGLPCASSSTATPGSTTPWRSPTSPPTPTSSWSASARCSATPASTSPPAPRSGCWSWTAGRRCRSRAAPSSRWCRSPAWPSRCTAPTAWATSSCPPRPAPRSPSPPPSCWSG